MTARRAAPMVAVEKGHAIEPALALQFQHMHSRRATMSPVQQDRLHAIQQAALDAFTARIDLGGLAMLAQQLWWRG